MSFELTWMGSGAAAAFVGYVVAGTFALNKVRQRRIEKDVEEEKKEEGFIHILEQSFRNNAVNSLSDVHDIYLGYFHEAKVHGWKHNLVTQLLRRFVVHVSTLSRVQLADEDRSYFLKLIKEAISESEALLEESQQIAPFAGTPDPERGLLTDIALLASAESAGVSSKLRELATVIRGRQETMDGLAEEKGKSLKWAKWGVFGTVFFSALSILITVLR